MGLLPARSNAGGPAFLVFDCFHSAPAVSVGNQQLPILHFHFITFTGRAK
jgi:hypothetical protein